MAFEGFDKFQGFLNEDPLVEARGSDVGLGDYILDLPKGVLKGGSQAIQGLLQLGALPIDYLADTNLLTNIENLFEKITPETKTAVGDITSVLTQFGVPGGAALKIASGMSKLKNVSQMTKLSSLPTAGAKGMELVKRGGYFGTIGGITDFAVSTPGTISTLSEDLGILPETDLEGLSGRERAAEIAKSKVKFGAEGTLLGAGVTLLPVAGTLGFKYGIVPGAKAIGYVGGKALRAVNYPVQKGIELLVGSKDTGLVQKGFQKLVGKGGLSEKISTKTGLASDELDRYIPAEGGFQSEMKRWFVRFKDQFTSPGPLRGEIKQIQVDLNTKLAAEERKFTDLTNRLKDNYKNIIENFKVKLFDQGESKVMIQYESNKIHDYIRATAKGDKEAKKRIIESIDNRVRSDVIRLGKRVADTDKYYKKFIKDIDFGGAIALDYNSYTYKNLAAFNNKNFKYDPTLKKNAVKFFKDRIKDSEFLSDEVLKKTKDQLGPGVKTTSDEFKEAFENNLTKEAEAEMIQMKDSVITSSKRPSNIFDSLNDELLDRGFIKEGEQFPDVIRRFFNVEEGNVGRKIKDPVTGKIVTKDIQSTDYTNAALDVVIEQNKQIYARRAFDRFLDLGLDKPNKLGFIFTADQIKSRGFSKRRLSGLQQVIKKFADKENISEVATNSKLFDGKYYTTPEIASALIGQKEVTDNLYNTIPFYKGLMTLKAGAQIAKTILSPVTQVRNFTTSSVFPLANGLIGQGVGFKDAWRLTAGDIFAGAKTDIEKISRIERLIERNVIDQNVNVQEIRRVLDRAKDGKISFNKMMKTPLMKTLTDIYQGADNYWKIYSDGAYQGALRTAFGNPDDIVKMAEGTKKAELETKFFNNIKDWYRTVAKEDYVPYNTLTGKNKTVIEALEDVSAYLTVNTVPTYSKVPNIIQNIRNLPLGNFIAFPAEILRTTSNIISIGARELTSTNPFIRQMGARRLLGVSTVLGGIGTVTQKTAQYVTGVSEEDMRSFQRSFAPSYQKNSTLVPLTAPDANGNFKYYNFSYSNPYDSLVTPVNAIFNAVADGRLKQDSVDNIVMTALFGGIVGGEGKRGAITEFVSPFVTESIGTERAVDVTLRRGIAADGKIVYYPNDTGNVKIAKSIDHILGGLTPGAFTSAQRIWDGATGRFTDFGTARDTKAEIAALMSGVRIEEAKPLSSMPFIMTSYNRDKQQIRSKFSRTAYSARSTPENKLAAFKTYALETFKSQNALYQTIEDAKTLGVSRSKLQDILEDRVTKTEAESILRGEFKVPTFSEAAFNSLFDRLKVEDPDRAFEIRRQNDAVQRIFDDVKKRLSRIRLDQPIDELDSFIEEILSPDVREFRRSDLVAPQTGIPAQGPQVSLPTQITGTPVASNVLSNQQNLGQRFNLTAQLSPEEKTQFLFGSRIV
jgi:hypothetical protein